MLGKTGHVKLIDFQTCKVLNPEIQSSIDAELQKNARLLKNQNPYDDSRNYSLVGTEEYISPETLMDRDVGYPADLWSLGCILYQMLFGETPFVGKTQMETYNNIKNKTEYAWKSTTDDATKDLITGLL